MATLGFPFATLGSAINQVLRLTNFLGGAQHRERRWGIRDQLIEWYYHYHAQLDLPNVRVRGITFTWTSGRTLDLSSLTATYTDASTSTGITGWRERPALIKSSGQNYKWQRETSAFIDRARDDYDRGDSSARYKWPEESRGFLYAIEGDNLITVESITSQTITFDHYREPTVINEQSSDDTEFEFPRDFMDLLIYNAVANEWMSALMTMPESRKEQRRVLETEYNRLRDPSTGMISKRERELEKHVEIPADIVVRPGVDIYTQIFHDAEVQWEDTISNIDRVKLIME